MAFVVASIASALITLAAIQQTPPRAASAQTPDALFAELIAHADALLAQEKVQLSDEDQKSLHDRITAAVSQSDPPSLERRAALLSRVEKTVRMIAGATRLASLVIDVRGDVPTGYLPPSEVSITCFPSKTFEQLTTQASQIVVPEPYASRLRLALTALLASAKVQPPREDLTCVSVLRLDTFLRELDAIGAGPAPNSRTAAPAELAPLSDPRKLSAGPVAPPTRAEDVKLAPKGIVDRILNAVCPYPFCL